MAKTQQAQILSFPYQLAFREELAECNDADVFIFQTRLWATRTLNAIYCGIIEPTEDVIQKLKNWNETLKELGVQELSLDVEFGGHKDKTPQQGIFYFPHQLAYRGDLDDCWDEKVIEFHIRLWATRHLNDIRQGVTKPTADVLEQLNEWNENLRALGESEYLLDFYRS